MKKRVYRDAHVDPTGSGYRVLLDRAPVHSQRRRELRFANENLARAVAAEWADQPDEIDTSMLRLTALAGRVADLTDTDRTRIGTTLVAYIETDLVCYRAERPPDLVELQAAAWDPMVGWAKQRFFCAPPITTGVLPTEPDPEIVACYAAVVAGLSADELVGLHAAATVTGSLLVALALLEGEVDADSAWQAGSIDECYNVARWGDDPEAAARRAGRRADLDAAAFYLAAYRGPSERR